MMSNKLKLVKFIFFLCFFLTLAFEVQAGEDPFSGAADFDLLDEFMDIEQEEKASSISMILDKFSTNLTGSLGLKNKYFIHPRKDNSQTENQNRKQWSGEALLNFSTNTGLESWQLNFGGWLETGTQDQKYSGYSQWLQDKDIKSHVLELNELYLQIFFSDFDLTIGKKIFKNGISTIYSPTDRYSPRDYHDPVATKALGSWLLRIDYYLEEMSLAAAVLPVFQPSKLPGKNSYWMAGYQDYDLLMYNVSFSTDSIYEDLPEVNIENISYFIKGGKKAKGWDLFSCIYYGINPFYVLALQDFSSGQQNSIPQASSIHLIKKNVKVITAATGFSTIIYNIEFHGEGLYNHSKNRKEDSYLHYVAGFTWTIDEAVQKIGLDRVDLVFEYIGTQITRKQSAPGYIRGFSDYGIGRDDLVSRLYLQVNEDLNFTIHMALQPGENSVFSQLKMEYKFSDDLFFQTVFENFSGRDNTVFGTWEKCDRVILSLDYNF
jgi:hypothetical protein